ncbi:MAG: hypothetical protein KJ057_10365 [Phycisphaerae bacterium]|nr:hypothetical protein [Planctomycetia bacterium]MCK6464525.1 hypothetical protein [Phycisphaerae bacterium]MCL4718862.1 hypothetical protein [Phycisphaerae bacterium]NUQ09902.1 hypothetical protein [Phycisphaerae bacterium]
MRSSLTLNRPEIGGSVAEAAAFGTPGLRRKNMDGLVLALAGLVLAVLFGLIDVLIQTS